MRASVIPDGAVGLRVEDEADRLLTLQRSYRQLPMSLADACVVRLSELEVHSRVLTTDAHFQIYRRNTRQLIPLLVPPSL